MKIAMSHKGLGHLSKAIGSTDTEIKLKPQEAQAFITLTGDYVYALLRGPIKREIVRIDVANSKQSGQMTIARGQGGSTATSWPRGTLVLATTNADHYNSIIQRGEHRQIDYNPNQILTPLFAGEEVYQNGPAGCERWWKSYNGINPYWDIITGESCLTEAYQDIGWTYDLLTPVIPPTQILNVYSLPGDGAVIAYNDGDWPTARNKATGDEVKPTDPNYDLAISGYLNGTWYLVGRTFLEFDLTAFTETGRDITKIELDIAPYGFTESPIMIVGSDFTGTVALEDFDNFQLTNFLDTPFELEMWDGGNYKRNIMWLNTAGENYVKSKFDGKVSFCLREYAHDVSNVVPVDINNRNGLWFIEIGFNDPIRTPRLVITYTKLPVWSDIHDNTKWTAVNGSWDGTKWHSAPVFDLIDLQAIGTWMNDYNPYKVRVEFTGCDVAWVDVFNQEGSGSLTDGRELVTSGQELVLVNYNNLPIDFMVISNHDDPTGPFTVENIEFLDP